MDERVFTMKINIFLLIVLTAFFASFSVTHAQKPSFFILFDICENDTVVIKEYGIQKIETPVYEESKGGNYSIIFTSTKGEIVLKYSFDVRFLIHAMEVDPETGEVKERWVKRECVEIYFRFPFFGNIKKISYKHFDKIIYEMDICNVNNICEKNKGETELNCPEDCGIKPICGNKVCESPQENQTTCCLDCGCPENLKCIENKCLPCGNNKCDVELGENYKLCPKDCPSGSKDNYCDAITDGRCDPDCKEGEDIDCIKPIASWIYFVIAGIVIGLIILLIVWSKRT